MQKAISRGTIHRHGRPSPTLLNLYQGSGRGGCCFRWHGLHEAGAERPGNTRTALMHADHWVKGAWGIDCWLPALRLLWDPALEAGQATAWEQTLDLSRGRLDTSFTLDGCRINLVTCFDPARRDVLSVDYTWQGDAEPPAIRLVPETTINSHYNQTFTVEATNLEVGPRAWRVRLATGSVSTLLAANAEGDAAFDPVPDGVRVVPQTSTGQVQLLIGIAAESRRPELETELAELAAGDAQAMIARDWALRWGDAFIDIPPESYQALWARSAYYALASYAPDVRSPAAPMGWSGNGWPFHFPQDVSYIHPALLRLGHYDIARAIVEYYHQSLEATMAATRRIYGIPGAMWAWEHPIGDGFGDSLLADGAPNQFQYEIHNAAYPARMAVETAAHLAEPEWTRRVAWPVVRESARFLASGCTQSNDGTWDLCITPASGQDEFGGKDQKNYLCAMYSAQYTLGKAVAMAAELRITDEPMLPVWRRILAEGLAWHRLLDPVAGLRATVEELVGTKWLGRQKHPVQLNPLMFLPLAVAPDKVTMAAFDQRRTLCAGLDRKVSHGWTLAAYWAAGAHLGDPDALVEDLAEARPCDYVDPDYIQIYETSGSHQATYYVTSHGLYLQALQDAFVSDYWGSVEELPACPDEWAGARYANLRTARGEKHSGTA